MKAWNEQKKLVAQDCPSVEVFVRTLQAKMAFARPTMTDSEVALDIFDRFDLEIKLMLKPSDFDSVAHLISAAMMLDSQEHIKKAVDKIPPEAANAVTTGDKKKNFSKKKNFRSRQSTQTKILVLIDVELVNMAKTGKLLTLHLRVALFQF